MSTELVWRIVKLPKRPIGGPWWLQLGREGEQQTWRGWRKKFIVRYEEPHKTREAAERSLSEWQKQGAAP